MSQTDQLLALAKFFLAGSNSAIDSLKKLPPRPDPLSASYPAWQTQYSTLLTQSQTLSGQATTTGGLAITAALQEAWQDLEDIQATTAAETAKIDAIAKVSASITELAKIIKLGVDVITFFAAPSIPHYQTVADSYDALKPKP